MSLDINYQIPRDFSLETARGTLNRYTSINKFGRSTNVDAVDTDIWDGANPTDDVATWIPPTQARVHAITSTSGSDADEGIGANTIRVWGLPSWSESEIFEDIILDGITIVNTTNSYVIIHRMSVLSSGASGPNVGTIKATAVTDGTVTAQINIGQGQTQMTIFGIPSNQTAYMNNIYCSLLKSNIGASAQTDIALKFASFPTSQLNVFLTQHTTALMSTGTSSYIHPFEPPKIFVGPGILKITALGSTANLDVSAGFDITLVDNN